MKISGFKIEDFAKAIYTADQTPEAHNLNGGPLLIHGPNTSGKSLSFNAIMYAILGLDQRLGVSPGGGNRVTITFDDGSQFTRGDPKRRYSIDDDVLDTEDAEEELWERLGDRDVIRENFLPSHLDELPLEKLDKRERLELILEVTNRASKRRMEEIEKEIERLNDEINQYQDSLSPLNNRKRDLSRKVSNLEGYQSEWKQVLDLSEGGELNDISDKLSEKEEVHRRLNELTSKKRGLKRKIDQKDKEKEELQRYQSDIEDIIVEALKEFFCPICDQRVSSETVKTRLQESNTCPFCGEDHSINSLRSHLEEKKTENEGKPEQLATEIAECQSELNEVESKISELESEMPEISKLNSLVVDRLDDGKSIDQIRQEAREELQERGEELEQKKGELKSVEEQLKKSKENISELEEERSELISELDKLESQSYSSAISTFESSWETHFQGLSGEPETELLINRETGEVALPGVGDDRRLYDRRGDLSDSELQLLNLSFALTLNEHGRRTSAINWGTIILDEPFSNLDSERKESSLDHLLDADPQIIMTSSDQTVISELEDHQNLKLERSSSRQSKFGEGGVWGA